MAPYMFLISLHSLIIIICCLEPNEVGVCYKTTNGNTWLECCKGYRYLQRKCEKCPPGKYSKNCERDCPESFYGEGCTFKCNCHGNEYCDLVFGCLCKNCTKLGNITEEFTTHDNRTDTDINIPLLLYIGIPCGVFFFLLGTVLKIIKRRSKMGEAKLNIPRELYPISERPYDYIDENVLEDICHTNETCPNHLDVTSFIQSEQNSFENSENSSMNSSLETEQQSSEYRDGYINPYNSLQTETKQVTYAIPLETSTSCDIPAKSNQSYDIPRSST